jgi:hypothetical protein
VEFGCEFGDLKKETLLASHTSFFTGWVVGAGSVPKKLTK